MFNIQNNLHHFLAYFLEAFHGLHNIHASDFKSIDFFFPPLHSTFLSLCFMSQVEKPVPSTYRNSWNINNYYSTTWYSKAISRDIFSYSSGRLKIWAVKERRL